MFLTMPDQRLGNMRKTNIVTPSPSIETLTQEFLEGSDTEFYFKVNILF